MRYILLIILTSVVYGVIIISDNPADQRQSTVAFLDNQYLVAWADARSYQTYQATVIYGSRVSSSGTVINPNGAVINAGNPDRLMPKVCAGSSGWLVTWHEGS
ncbi:MAG: hypothetical protein KGZ86_01435 [Candidatus Latescibacteria bacterium]|nr:hypothetical protein [Candidatus Latescibacterota bacterium]